MKYASESSMFRTGSSTVVSLQDDAQMATGFLGPWFTAEFRSWVSDQL